MAIRTRLISVLAPAFLLVSSVAFSANQSEDRFVTVGTGGVTGVYYPAGGAICRLVNAERDDHGIRCTVESTAGSVFNINALQRGALEFAIVQSDFQAYAVNGDPPFQQSPFRDLRALFSLHSEPIQLMSRADSGIENFMDLKGKRVNIGNPGSGQRVMMEMIMSDLGWTTDDFDLVSALRPAEQAAALCDDRIDAAFWAAGIPNGSVQEATSTCDINLVPLSGEWTDEFLDKYPFYAPDVIPGGIYPGNEDDVPTFGARATFVTTAGIPDSVAYQIVHSVFENLGQFRELHPAFSHLTRQEMSAAALTAPLHPGAMEYYTDTGIK